MTEEPPDPTRHQTPSLRRQALQELTKNVVSGLEGFLQGKEINGHAHYLNALRANLSERIESEEGAYRIMPSRTDSIGHILRATTHYFGNIEPEEFPRKVKEFAEGLSPETISRETAKRYVEALLKFGSPVESFGSFKPKV